MCQCWRGRGRAKQGRRLSFSIKRPSKRVNKSNSNPRGKEMTRRKTKEEESKPKIDGEERQTNSSKQSVWRSEVSYLAAKWARSRAGALSKAAVVAAAALAAAATGHETHDNWQKDEKQNTVYKDEEKESKIKPVRSCSGSWKSWSVFYYPAAPIGLAPFSRL